MKKEKTTVVTKQELIGELSWREAVRSRKVVPYFKPTRRKHESGYRIVEIGYITVSGDRKQVIGECSDHISWMEGLTEPGRRQPSINIDVDDGGHIRIYSGFKWQDDDYALSSALLEYVGEMKDQ